MKSAVMLIGLAAVFASGIACAKLFSSSSAADPAAVPASSCDGLTGQAKIDCENAKR